MFSFSHLLEYVILFICIFSAFCRYVQFYELSEPIDDVYYFLTHIAKRRKLIKKLRSPNG